jgi:hypothetical protein
MVVNARFENACKYKVFFYHYKKHFIHKKNPKINKTQEHLHKTNLLDQMFSIMKNAQ